MSSSFAQHEIIWSSFTELEQALPTGRWHIHVLFHAVHLRKTSGGYKIKHNKLLKFFEYENQFNTSLCNQYRNLNMDIDGSSHSYVVQSDSDLENIQIIGNKQWII